MGGLAHPRQPEPVGCSKLRALPPPSGSSLTVARAGFGPSKVKEALVVRAEFGMGSLMEGVQGLGVLGVGVSWYL